MLSQSGGNVTGAYRTHSGPYPPGRREVTGVTTSTPAGSYPRICEMFPPFPLALGKALGPIYRIGEKFAVFTLC